MGSPRRVLHFTLIVDTSSLFEFYDRTYSLTPLTCRTTPIFLKESKSRTINLKFMFK